MISLECRRRKGRREGGEMEAGLMNLKGVVLN